MKYLYLDARYEKVRHDGQVRNSAVLLAVGVNEDGNREVLGVSVALGEHEVHWRNFLQSLVSRGLSGVELITSDDHSGLKSAGKAVFGGVCSPAVGGPTFLGSDVNVTYSVTKA